MKLNLGKGGELPLRANTVTQHPKYKHRGRQKSRHLPGALDRQTKIPRVLHAESAAEQRPGQASFHADPRIQHRNGSLSTAAGICLTDDAHLANVDGVEEGRTEREFSVEPEDPGDSEKLHG
ncbi:hypothetical protein ACRRTK_018700 [Alexandromys fortis]